MNNMKKSLLALALVSMTASVLPYHGHGGSGFGAGLAVGALGTGVALAATDRGYYDDYPVVAPVVYDDYYNDGDVYYTSGRSRGYRNRNRGRSSSRSSSTRSRTYVNRR